MTTTMVRRVRRSLIDREKYRGVAARHHTSLVTRELCFLGTLQDSTSLCHVEVIQES